MDILGILTNYNPFFKIGNVISDFIRFLLWGLVSILCFISDGVEKIVTKIYSFNNFFANKDVIAIVEKFKGALWIVLTLSILYIGYKLVIDREFKGERIFQNFILSFMVILALPAFMVNMNQITTKAVEDLSKTETNTTTARSIITDNIYDLKYLEKQGFNIKGDLNDSSTKTNNLKAENVLLIPINATIDRNFFDKEVFKKKIEIDENGEKSVVDLEKSFFGFIEEQYYRFNFNFLPMIIMLLSLILTFILTSIKIARIIIELGFKQVFAMMLAFGDISSGQKLKTILKDILASFGIIFATAVLLKLYSISTLWINTLNGSNIFIEIIFIIASSLMVIDAPNIIERILGIDAGIKSGWSLIASAYTGTKTMASIGGSKIGNSMSAVAGGAKGIYDGFNSSTLEEESKSANNKNNSDSKSDRNESKLNSDNSNSNFNSNNLNSNETGKSLAEESNNMQDNNQLSSNETLDNNSNISSEYGEAPSLSDDMNSNIGSSYKEQETLSENLNASENADLSTLSNTDDGVQPSLESENKVNYTSLGNESSKDCVQQSLESEIKSSENSSINDNVSSNSSDSLSNDISKESSSKSISDAEQKPLDSNIKLDNNLNSQSMNDSSNKPVGNSESLKTGKSDRDVIKNSEKLETRGLGQYAKDSLKESKNGQIAKKHYNLGVNTGKAFRNYMDKKNGKGSK